MTRKNVHLVCHSHIDPVWLWQWEEGLGVALSTFRTAADFCEEHQGFIFNHNEALLYMWAEGYEPELFERIKRLVAQGKWHIMGGWYLQPDCNMPSGESFVRQILVGKSYFKEKFGVEPTAAFNIDSFGTTRGLVQIMAKSGHKYYLHGRPGQNDCELPADQYIWVGFDGSEIIATRPLAGGTALGAARGKVEKDLQAAATGDEMPFFAGWGLGDHGGGPTRKDYAELVALMAETTQVSLFESTLDAYFEELSQWKDSLPRYEGDLNAWGIGCYTSQVRIKQKHRLLENDLYAAEKMASSAAIQGLREYPSEELRTALLDLLFCQFHDILPGSSIRAAEEDAIRTLDHGLEITNRVKTKAFFALAAGQEKASNNQLPILVCNPHPFPIKAVIECDFSLPDDVARVDGSFVRTPVYQNGLEVPSQSEKEGCNIPEQWRKRVVFLAELEPSRMNRFDCGHEVLDARPEFALKSSNGAFVFKNDHMEVVINTKTGLVDRYRVGGVDYVSEGCSAPLVMMDDDDPWGMNKQAIREVVGQFELMSEEEGRRFSSINDPIPTVRVVEDGDVRTVVEALFKFESSEICQRYLLPKYGSEIEFQMRVYWREAYRCLKVSIPTLLGQDARYLGQVAYGVQELPYNGNEAVAQQWVAAVSADNTRAVSCINDGIYGSDFSSDGLRMTLLRSAAYSAHPIAERVTVWQDRYEARIDQGERSFRFWLNAGEASERLKSIHREAIIKNERPMVLQVFPSGLGTKPESFITLTGDTVHMPAAKMSEDGNALIIRLFEPTGNGGLTELAIPRLGVNQQVNLSSFEIKTLRVDLNGREVTETDLLENPLGGALSLEGEG